MIETEELRTILDEFLARWPKSEVEKMTLSQYVDLGSQDTFCQWVERGTRPLGSILGWPGSIKFGIYRREDKNKRPQHYRNDEEYSWLPKFGDNRKEAFAAIKGEIKQIIRYASSGDFSAIDDLHLLDLFKWKVASLYSNERLVPVFKREVLNAAAAGFGLRDADRATISRIQEVFIRNKPAGKDIYHYMWDLFARYGHGGDIAREREKIRELAAKRRIVSRRATDRKNTEPQLRSASRSYIAAQKHNQLQEALKKKLVEQYGSEAVSMEADFVDVKLVLPDQIVIYEVKSASYASDCVKQALGQALAYTFHDTDGRRKKIVVVGQFPPTEIEIDFIRYVKSQVSIDFDYENIDI